MIDYKAYTQGDYMKEQNGPNCGMTETETEKARKWPGRGIFS